MDIDKKEKQNFKLSCADCGQTLDTNNISSHKCKIWRVLLFGKQITILGMVFFAYCSHLIIISNVEFIVKLLLAALVGLLFGMLERYLVYLKRK